MKSIDPTTDLEEAELYIPLDRTTEEETRQFEEIALKTIRKVFAEMELSHTGSLKK